MPEGLAVQEGGGSGVWIVPVGYRQIFIIKSVPSGPNILTLYLMMIYLTN